MSNDIRPAFPLIAIQQHERFLAEREQHLHRGEIGRCKECGKPDPIGWTLICRRRKCSTCRANARARFEISVLTPRPS